MTEKKTSERTAQKSPVKTVRRGAVGASVWLETGAEGAEYFTISLSRAWKSKSSGKTGYSNKFFARNRAELHQVIDQVCDAVEELERGATDAKETLAA